jgi:hypothetical protein
LDFWFENIQSGNPGRRINIFVPPDYITYEISLNWLQSNLMAAGRIKPTSSAARRFVKSAQFSLNIAQNGALPNKNFCPKKFLVKIWEFEDKN